MTESARASSSLAELHGVTKRYGGHTALRDLTLTIPPGVTGLLGPNGAGKSTFIKVLMGLVRINSGSGHILGEPLGKSRRTVLERIGYLPEDDCFIPGLSGVEAVQLAARMSRLPSREGLRRAHEMLDFCGMGQERYRPVETYSTGMRQKLKFATALVHDPELLILDEPTSGLDPDERNSVLRRIRRLADKFGKSVILCTHILPDIEAISDYVVILSQGLVRLHERLEVLKRPVAPQVHVSILGDSAAFLRAVQSAGVEYQANAKGDVVLNGDIGVLTDRVWEWARDSQAVIRQLVPAKNSLQHVFLTAVKDEPIEGPVHAHT